MNARPSGVAAILVSRSCVNGRLGWGALQRDPDDANTILLWWKRDDDSPGGRRVSGIGWRDLAVVIVVALVNAPGNQPGQRWLVALWSAIEGLSNAGHPGTNVAVRHELAAWLE